MNKLPNYKSIINEIILNKKWKYPEKAALPFIQFNYYSSQVSGMIKAQVKAPTRFSPRLFDRTLILLIDESGKPEFPEKGDSLFKTIFEYLRKFTLILSCPPMSPRLRIGTYLH